MKMLILALTILVSSNSHASGCDSQFERYDAENVTLKRSESVWLRKKKIEFLKCSWGYAQIKMIGDEKVYTAFTGWGDFCSEVDAAILANMNHKIHLGFENAQYVPYDNCNDQMESMEVILSGRMTYTIDHGGRRLEFSYPFYSPETERLPSY